MSYCYTAHNLGQGNILRSECEEFCPRGGGCLVPGGVSAPGGAWSGGVPGPGGCLVPGGALCWGVPGPGGCVVPGVCAW